MERLKLCVVGHRQHGKDTVCEYLRDLFDLTFVSSSMYCCQKFIFDQTKDLYGYKTVQECFDDRHDKRADWFVRISDYVKDNYSRLSTEILEQWDMYCGMRNRNELVTSYDLFDAFVWVDASKRKPMEAKDSMTILEMDTHCTIDNNGPADQLPRIVEQCYTTLTTKLNIVRANSQLDTRFIFR